MNSSLLQEITRFTEIISRLRKDCPWDREQTHQSLAAPLIEEAYETVEAIENENFGELRKELGDLLLHIVFQADLAAEEGHFTLEDVIRGESEKLIYRHPHVFGDTKADTAEAVSENWEKLKRKESGRTSILDGVPVALPALQRAERLQEKASKVGFDWDDPTDVLNKIREELDEFAAATNQAEREDEFGDLLFSLVNFSRHSNIEAERSLRQACEKFNTRFRTVEQMVEKSGRSWDSFTLPELDKYWDIAKQNAREGGHSDS